MQKWEVVRGMPGDGERRTISSTSRADEKEIARELLDSSEIDADSSWLLQYRVCFIKHYAN